MSFPALEYPTVELWEILNQAVQISRDTSEERELSRAVAENLDMDLADVRGVFDENFAGKQCLAFDAETQSYDFVDDRASDGLARTIAIRVVLPQFETEYRAKYGNDVWDDHFGTSNPAATIPADQPALTG